MVIALLAWLLLRALGRQNSGTRFAVWFAALLGIAALPLLGTLASNGAGLAKPSEITMPGSWALYIFAAWLLIAAAGLLRVGIGFWHLHGFARVAYRSILRCSTLDTRSCLRNTLAEFDSPRAVTALRVRRAAGSDGHRVHQADGGHPLMDHAGTFCRGTECHPAARIGSSAAAR